MAILWQSSLVPFTDPNGAPYSGAKAFFFDATTTTPRVVYRNSGLDNPHDHPVVANASGMFPAVFLPVGPYRLRIEDADGVTIWDVDGISTPAESVIVVPDTGGTDITLLARTGDLKARYAVGTHSGWVRANGRSIGSPVSGATERANADCEALFLHLWTEDANLAVSGGRGATAAGDWAAGKTITLPDFRNATFVGLDEMGNASRGLITDALVAGSATANTLGGLAGSAFVSLTVAQLAAHDHGGATGLGGAFAYPVRGAYSQLGSGQFTQTAWVGELTANAPNHTHPISSQGSGEGHPNVQPSVLTTIYIKL